MNLKESITGLFNNFQLFEFLQAGINVRTEWKMLSEKVRLQASPDM